MKKIVVISLLALCVGLGLYFINTGASGDTFASTRSLPADEMESCGVSVIKANPEQYLGKVKISGKAANVYPQDGVVELADEKACCAIFLLVPTSDAQKEKLGVASLYKGEFPKRDQNIEVEGLLEKTSDGYAFIVSRITSKGEVLVERI